MNPPERSRETQKALGVKNAVILDQEAEMRLINGLKVSGKFESFSPCSVLPSRWISRVPGYKSAITAGASQHRRNSRLGPIVAEPALQPVDQAEKTVKITVCTFDISPAIVAALVKKQVEFAIDQQEWLQGYLPVVFLANYVRYGSILQNDLILTGPSFVTPENAQKVVNLLSLGFH
jgi:simple sugar transport system substrate-binding protein